MTDALPLTDGQPFPSRFITERRTGTLNVQIANAAVQVYRAQTGRGPTKSRTYIENNLVVVELRETLTNGERNLVAAGQREVVRTMRRAYRALIHEQLVEAIEGLLDRKVLALLSDSHLDPDVAVEVFVLEPDS